MQVNLKVLLTCSVLSAVAGGMLVHRYARQNEIINRETIKNNVVTVIKRIKAADGGSETTTTIIDKTKQNLVVKNKETQWLFAVGYDTKRNVSAQANKRIVGPVFVGLGYNQNGTATVNVGVEF